MKSYIKESYQLILLTPELFIRLVFAAFWDMFRFVSGWVWYCEEFLIPEKYHKKEIFWIIWTCRWPSMYDVELWLHENMQVE